MENNKDKSIGAMWLRTSKSGNKFMTGNIEIQGKKHQFVVFKNKYKQGETHPDYVILPSNPIPAEQRKPDSPALAAVRKAFVDDINSEEIPF